MSNELKVRAEGDREIVMTRGFAAPRRLVYEAYTKPELLVRWLGVTGGWTLAVCEVDLREGGEYRWVWRHPEHGEMGMRGVYRELEAPGRIVCTEVFDEAWYPGEGLVTVVFVEQAGVTSMTVTLRYESREARDGVLRSPMESGVAKSYDNLAALVATML